MSAEAELYTALTGATGVTDLVSTRIYPNRVPLGTDYPAIGYSTITGAKIASNNCKETRVQVDCFAETYSATKSVKDAVLAVIDANQNWLYIEGPDIYEDDTLIHHQSVDVIITH
jgi:hypothetical protein